MTQSVPVHVKIKIFGRWITVWKYRVRRRATYRGPVA